MTEYSIRVVCDEASVDTTVYTLTTDQADVITAFCNLVISTVNDPALNAFLSFLIASNIIS